MNSAGDEVAPRILLVEDEWLIAEEMSAELREANYTVIGPASAVAAGLTLIERESIDVALLDIRLTDETSFPIADALLAREIPFAFVTGYSRQEVPLNLREQTILSKPLTEKMLLSAVSDLLEARRKA